MSQIDERDKARVASGIAQLPNERDGLIQRELVGHDIAAKKIIGPPRLDSFLTYSK